MTEITTDKPVFIDQMPDYQQALGQIVLLSKDQSRFLAVVHELGMDDDFRKLAGTGETIKAQAQGLQEIQKKLDDRSAQINARESKVRRTSELVGNIAMLGSGFAAGMVGAKRGWGMLKTGLVSMGTAASAGAIWLIGDKALRSRPSPETTALVQDSVALDFQKQQLVESQVALGTQFVSDMATRMLEQQKMLTGQGADMHLVSTKEASPASSMAAKYATPPAASRAEAVQATVSVEMRR